MSTVFEQSGVAIASAAPAIAKPGIRRHGRMVTAMTVAVALVVGGCAATDGMTDAQRRTTIGTGIGAAVGAAIGGNQAGSKGVRNGALIGGAIAGIGTYVWSRQMEEQKRAMEAATEGTGVQVTQTRENLLQLDIPSDISFDVNRAVIRPAFRPILDRFAQTLVANPATTVQIIGHTDSTGNDTINNPLSVNRAAATRDYLVSHGVLVSRIMIDGRGSHDPIADNRTAQGRAQNRRVEIYVGQAADQSQTQNRQQQSQQRSGSGQWGNVNQGGYQNDGYVHTIQ
ncbi:MAG: OmpA family protein [Lautropia sp.]|nr:OmpA family protein [Lautropia sp.]